MGNEELEDLRGTMRDLHFRAMATSVAVKALLRTSPATCEALKGFITSPAAFSGAGFTDNEREALTSAVASLLPGGL